MQQRLHAHVLQQDAVSGLLREMAGDDGAARVGRNRASYGRSRGTDEAVDDHRDAMGGRAQHHAGDGCDLQAADAAQNFQRVRLGGCEIAEMKAQRLVDDLRLRQRSAARSRPVPRPVSAAHRLAGQRRGNCRRRAGVADAHLAQRDQGAALRAGFGGQIDADLQRGVQFGLGHGGFAGKVAGSAAHLAMQSGRQRRRSRHRLRHRLPQCQSCVCRARTLMAAPPLRKLRTICCVTSRG